jgi:VIT1/CCC1 family predicted Fe2+/Mn2+ transporter
MPKSRHAEHHHISRTGWLRAAVLGANDGILSTASLILGVATATHSHGAIFVSGFSGLVAGAFSMAAGEYVSVSSQADVEKAALDQERRELAEDEEGELKELTGIYVKRGLDRSLAAEVARQLTRKDALAAHARDELGISKVMSARPIQAAAASAASFSAGAAIPLLAGVLVPETYAIAAVYGVSLLFLMALGALAARTGDAPMLPGTIRVTLFGAAAMAATAAIGLLFHVSL